MKTSTRVIILGASGLLCLAGILTVHPGSRKDDRAGNADEANVTTILAGDYQFAVSSEHPTLTFRQLETIIRRDPTAKSQRGRIEFGSVKMEQRSAVAEVMFVNNDRVTPFLYKLQPERDSWKIVNVQRMWYVPRSHLLRGVRA